MKADRNIRAPVLNIQTYSIHDGPGIRDTVFLKGCPLRCIWCQNPESLSSKPQLMVYTHKCTGCAACVNTCPTGAISMDRRSGKAMCDRKKCIVCGKCVQHCVSSAREIAGKLMNVDEVLEKVLRDKLFLDESGGGITLSGGEMLYHPEFSAALLAAAHEEGLHTVTESCNFASRDTVDLVYTNVDLAICDIKHMNSETHKKLTGVPNEIILDNIRHIARELHVPLIIRIPVIPNCNDSDENIATTAKFVAQELSEGTQLQLLPYNNLGESKNESLGRVIPFTAHSDDERIKQLKVIAESFGISVQIGG